MPTFVWRGPIQVTDGGHIVADAPDHVNDLPGIYFFSRRFGGGPYEPFYIGMTVQLSARLSQYLHGNGVHETRIRNVLTGGYDEYSGVRVQNGPRYFHFGELQPVQGLQIQPTIQRAERALIQYVLILGHQLINNHHAGNAALNTFDMMGKTYGRLIPRKLISH